MIRRFAFLIIFLPLMFPFPGTRLMGQEISPHLLLVKAYMRNVYILIRDKYLLPVDEGNILRGALRELAKLDPDVHPPSSPSWREFESIFLRSAAKSPKDVGRMGEASIRGMLKSLNDPYSTLLSSTERTRFEQGFESVSACGIGVEVAWRDGNLVVMAPLQGTPAERAGMIPGDRIESVGGQSISGMEPDRAMSLLEGEPGTSCVIVLKRKNEKIRLKITREQFSLKPVEAKIFHLSSPVGYIRIPYFGPRVSREVNRALRTLQARGVSTLVLDLRNNPGGDLQQAVKTAGLFLGKNPVAYMQKRDDPRNPIVSPEVKRGSFTLTVLVNDGTASSAELAASALSESGCGILVGSRTFGKCLVQSIFALTGGYALKLTTGRYLTLKGRDIEEQGLEPHVQVNSLYPFPPPLKDPVVLKAITCLLEKGNR